MILGSILSRFLEIIIIVSTIPKDREWRKLASLIVTCLKIANIIFIIMFWFHNIKNSDSKYTDIFFILVAMTIIDSAIFIWSAYQTVTKGLTKETRWLLLVVDIIYFPITLLVGITRKPLNIIIKKAIPHIKTLPSWIKPKDLEKIEYDEKSKEFIVSERRANEVINKMNEKVNKYVIASNNVKNTLKSIPWLFDKSPTISEQPELVLNQNKYLYFKYSELSPFYLTLFKIDSGQGMNYFCCVEQYVQSRKAIVCDRWDIYDLIMHTKNPYLHRKYGDSIETDEKKWTNEKYISTVREGTRLKFEQNAILLYSIAGLDIDNTQFIYNIDDEKLGVTKNSGENIVGNAVYTAVTFDIWKQLENLIADQNINIPVIYTKSDDGSIAMNRFTGFDDKVMYFDQNRTKGIRYEEIYDIMYIGNELINNNTNAQIFVNEFKSILNKKIYEKDMSKNKLSKIYNNV